MSKTFRLLPLLLAASTAALGQAQLGPDEAALEAHVAFLADDTLKGREAGTPEYDIAANYVAQRMLAAGLAPAGDNGGWFQKVPLVSYKAADKGSVVLDRGGRRTELVWGEDYLTRSNPAMPKVDVSGPVVFAGYGLIDPPTGHDDYRGLDVRGKIVAVLRDAPASLPSEVRAHYSGPDAKVAAAASRGAKAVILIESSSRHEVFPFERNVKSWDSAAMTWAEANGAPHVETTGTPAFAYLSFAGAAKLFAGSKLDWPRTLAADKAGRAIRTGDLGVAVQGVANTAATATSSSNVVGRLQGSDPTLAPQTVVLSAHLDHIGITKPDESGDSINNGALDNAIGTATLLEVARSFQTSGKKPRRSILFVAVTAEEKGLIGSEYFALHPTQSAGTIVANVNFDMPILTFKFEDLVVYGADRTSIGPAVAEAARGEGLVLTPDPEPEQAAFVRSDHYSFVKAGIPAVSLEPGPKGAGKAAIETFIEHHYHQPSDDLSQPIDWSQGVRFVRVNYGIVRVLSDGDARPSWNRGDFFGKLYNGYGAK